MANTYRVDRSDSKTVVPCGMNSILYSGDSLRLAKKYFASFIAGYTEWGVHDPSYGIVLSQWNEDKHDYVVLDSKFLPAKPGGEQSC